MHLESATRGTQGEAGASYSVVALAWLRPSGDREGALIDLAVVVNVGHVGSVMGDAGRDAGSSSRIRQDRRGRAADLH